MFPRGGQAPAAEAAIVTTSGGLTGGDRVEIDVNVGASASACITTQAAEKIYRASVGAADTEIAITLDVGADGVLEWMPQETILFDQARLRRSTHVSLQRNAQFLGGEIVCFGRTAFGETFDTGRLADDWAVLRDGESVWLERLRLDGDVAAVLADPNCFDGATATGLIVVVSGDPDDDVRVARTSTAAAGIGGVLVAASRVDDIAVVRFLSRDAQALRASFAACWTLLRTRRFGLQARLPRLWECWIEERTYATHTP